MGGLAKPLPEFLRIARRQIGIADLLGQLDDGERPHAAAKLERVADAMGEPDDGSGDGSRAVRAVRRLLADLDFPVLSSIGIGEADVPRLTELALADFFITMAPHDWTRDEVAGAFEEALALSSRA